MNKLILSTLLFVSAISAFANEVYDKYPNGDIKKGEEIFTTKHAGGNFESCTTCHTSNLKSEGKHAKTGRAIKPMAPIANPNRLTELVKTEKWFKRNCNDVLGKECSAQEKADVIAYLRSIK